MKSWGGGRVGRRGRETFGALAFVTLGCLVLYGCIVGDTRCSENQRVASHSRSTCECIEGTVPDPKGYGCKKCGEHESAINQSCECDPGYARESPTGPCEEVEGSALGEACDEESPCTAPHPYCAESGEEGYCTREGCQAQADCPIDWLCVEQAGTSYCKKLQGLLQPCDTAEDCAGTDAPYCSYSVKSCLIIDCVGGTNLCPSGYVCCDLQALAGISACAPSALLTAGLCPDGKEPVPQ